MNFSQSVERDIADNIVTIGAKITEVNKLFATGIANDINVKENDFGYQTTMVFKLSLVQSLKITENKLADKKLKEFVKNFLWLVEKDEFRIRPCRGHSYLFQL